MTTEKEKRKQLKEDFVAEAMAAIEDASEATEHGYIIALHSMSKVEDQLGKDLSEFNSQEILNYYRSRSWTSLNFITMKNHMLIRYTDWCINNHYTDAQTNYYYEINDKEILASCLNSILVENKFITREEILRDLEEKVPNYCDKFLILGVYEGIASKDRNEFKNLYLNQFEGNILHLNGRDIEVSPELIEFAEKSANAYEYYGFLDGNPASFDTAYSGRGFKEEDKSIVKARVNVNPAIKDTYRRRVDLTMDRIVKVTGNTVYSFMNIKNSGKIAYMKELQEKDEKCVSLTALLNRHSDEIINKYGSLNRNYLLTIASIFKK